MSVPKYSSSNYDSAANRYTELSKQYSGLDMTVDPMQAAKQAQNQAKGAAEAEGAAAQNLARNAGYSRARAAMAGATAQSNAYKNAYGNSYNNAYSAMQNNKNAQAQQKMNLLNSQQALMQGAAQKDQNKYTSDSNAFGAKMGAIGGLLNGVASVIPSDERTKDIKKKTDVNARRDELIARLRGRK